MPSGGRRHPRGGEGASTLRRRDLLALLQVGLAVLLWRSGDGPAWIALAGLALLLAIVLQNVMGQTSQLAVHVPLGVAILGLIGTLLGRTRNLDRASTDPSAPSGKLR